MDPEYLHKYKDMQYWRDCLYVTRLLTLRLEIFFFLSQILPHDSTALFLPNSSYFIDLHRVLLVLVTKAVNRNSFKSCIKVVSLRKIVECRHTLVIIPLFNKQIVTRMEPVNLRGERHFI